MEAVIKKKTEILRRLLYFIPPSYILLSDTNGRSAIYFACKSGNTKTVELLFVLDSNSRNTEKRTRGRETPLLLA